MRIYKLALIFIILMFCLIMSCHQESLDSETDTFPFESTILADIIKPDIIDVYEYPIFPGSSGWDTLDQIERFEVMQIPDSILKNISTWGLIETCFNYPLFGDFTALSDMNYSSYINELSVSFNGLKELYIRYDIGKLLLYTYRNLDVTKFKNPLKLNFIELVIGCYKFVTQLNTEQSIFLVAVAYRKSEDQKKNLDISIPFSVFIMGNTMIHANYKPFIDYCALKKEYIYSGILKRFNSSEEKIEEYAKMFIEQ